MSNSESSDTKSAVEFINGGVWQYKIGPFVLSYFDTSVDDNTIILPVAELRCYNVDTKQSVSFNFDSAEKKLISVKHDSFYRSLSFREFADYPSSYEGCYKQFAVYNKKDRVIDSEDIGVIFDYQEISLNPEGEVVKVQCECSMDKEYIPEHPYHEFFDEKDFMTQINTALKTRYSFIKTDPTEMASATQKEEIDLLEKIIGYLDNNIVPESQSKRPAGFPVVKFI